MRGIIIIVLLLVLFGRVGIFILVFCIGCYGFSCNTCDAVHELFSVLRLCIFSKFCNAGED